MWALKLLAFLAAFYAGVVLIAYVAQTALLFPTRLAGGPRVLPPGAEQIACDTPDGVRLHGMSVPPAPGTGADGATLLGFGGNAQNADELAAYLHALFPAREVVTFHYRGYRPSTGRPAAAALLDDGLIVYDCLRRRRTGANTIVAIGLSIGSGVAARLARERPVDGLILVTPFDTLEGLASQHYGWLPVGLLLRHRMFPVDDLRHVSAPVAVIAAERDSIVPAQRTAPLRKATRNLVLDRTIAGAGHNDIYDKPDFARAVHQAMKLITDRAKARRTDQP